MRDFRFYLDHDSVAAKRRGEHAGNVTAIMPDSWYAGPDGRCFEAVGAVYHHPDSPVATTGASRAYLRNQGKRISEAKARQIHPQLFAYLDKGE